MVKLPPHLFASEDGALYDTRVDNWNSKPPLRKIYKGACPEITNTQELKAALRAGCFAWPGGYPIYFLTNEGEALSFEGVRDRLREELCAIQNRERERIVACDINWEDSELYCAHSGKRIESAYTEPDD